MALTPHAPATPPRQALRGFALPAILGALAVAGVVASAIGSGSILLARMSRDATYTDTARMALKQAVMMLVTESVDSDGDGFPESPAMDTSGSTKPSGGGTIPSSSAAPKSDAWSTAFGYCAWDNGGTHSSTGRIDGDNPATQSSIVLAVVSAGANKTFDTSCAQAKSGNTQGDDVVMLYSTAQVLHGVGGTIYWGDPVTDYAALTALPSASLHNGEQRIQKDTGQVWRWDGAAWKSVNGISYVDASGRVGVGAGVSQGQSLFAALTADKGSAGEAVRVGSGNNDQSISFGGKASIATTGNAVNMILNANTQSNQLVLDGTGKVGIRTNDFSDNMGGLVNTFVGGGLRMGSILRSDSAAFTLWPTRDNSRWIFDTANASLMFTTTGGAPVAKYGTSDPLGQLSLYAGNAEAMRVSVAGNVGIGTATPGYKLDVNGVVNAQGGYYGNGGNVVLGIAGQGNTLNNMTNGQNALTLSQGGAGAVAGALTVNTNAASPAMLLKAATGQTADVLQVRSFAGTGGDLLTLSAAGNLGLGTTSPAFKLDVVGDINASGNVYAANIKQYALTRTWPTTVGDTVDIGSFAIGNSGHNLDIAVTVSSSNYSTAKRYLVPANFCGACSSQVWTTALPLTSTGAYAGNDSELEVMQDNAAQRLYLRLRRSSGTTAGTATVNIHDRGAVGDTFTASSTVNTAPAAATGYWPGTALTQVGARVGIGTASPNKLLTLSSGVTNQNLAIDDTGLYFSRTVDGGYNTSITRSGTSNAVDLNFNAYGNQFFTNNGTTLAALSTGAIGVASTGVFNIAALSQVYNINGVSNNPLSLISDDAAGGSNGIVFNRSSRTAAGNNAVSVWQYSSTELARVTTAGNLALGTTAPTARIHVQGGTADEVGLRLASSNPGGTYAVISNGNGVAGRFGVASILGDNNAFTLQSDQGGAADNRIVLRRFAQSGETAKGIVLQANGDLDDYLYFTTVGNVPSLSSVASGGGAGNMAVMPAGNLGIGTTTPAKTLHVAGTAGTANVRLASLGSTPLITALTSSDGLVVADSNGDLTKRSASTVVANALAGSDFSNNNLAYNGDFESGTADGWTAGTTPSIVSGGYAGNHAAQFTGSSTLLSNNYIPVDATKDVLQLEFFAKKAVAGSNPGVIYLGYVPYDANKVQIDTPHCHSNCYFAATNIVLPADGAWHKYSATSTGEGSAVPNFPAGTKFVRILGLINYQASADAVTLVDHISLKRINFGPLYVGNNFTSPNLVDQHQATQLYTTASSHFIISPPSGGNVGIGTTAPSSRLVVAGTAPVLLDTEALPTWGAIGFVSPLSAGNHALSGQSAGTVLNAPSGGYLAFRSGNGDLMRMTSSGNFGIGTTAPSNRVHLQFTDGSAATNYTGLTVENQAPGGSQVFLNLLTAGYGTGHTAQIVGGSDNVNGAVSTYLAFRNKINGGASPSEAMRIYKDLVGIGTSAPLSTLHVNGLVRAHGTANSSRYAELGSAGGQAFLKLRGSDGNFARITTDQNALILAPANGQVWVGGADANGDPISGGGSNPMMIGANTASIGGFYYPGTGYGIKVATAAAMYFENTSPDANTDAFVFNHTGAAGRRLLDVAEQGTSRFTILTSGNVGIGTNTPGQALHVVGNARITGALYDSSNAPGTAGQLLTSTATGTQWQSLGSVVSGTVFVQGGNSFGALAQLGTNDGNALAIRTAGVERLRVDTAGNVGIGSTSPYEKFEVNNGNISLLGAVNTSRALKWISTYGPGNTTASITGDSNAGWGGVLKTWVGRDYGGSGAQFGTVMGVADDPTGYPNQNTHLSVNTLSSTPSQLGVLYVGTGSNAANSRTGLYVETGAVLAATRGNVGIGTASPAAMLDVNGSAIVNGNATVRGTNNDGSAYTAALDVNGAMLRIGDPSGPRTFPNGMGIKFYDTNVAHASMVFNSSASRMDFGRSSTVDGLTLDTPTAPTLSLNLGNGNVGIGTASPGAKLDVYGAGTTFRVFDSANSDQFLVRSGSGTFGMTEAVLKGQGQTLSLYANPQATTSAGTYATYAALTSGLYANSALVLGSGNTERLRIDATGNVGLGTTSPSTKLHVDSGTLFDSGLRLSQLGSPSQTLSTTISRAIGVDSTGKVVLTNAIASADNRAVDLQPQDRPAGLYADFKTNTTNGLTDGGTYNGVLTFRSYGNSTDLSGGYPMQLAYTENGNLFTRMGTSATTWGSWNKLMSASNVGSTAYVRGGNSFGALATLGTNDANALALRTNGVERLRVDTAGNVGIGTLAPGAKLEVEAAGGATAGVTEVARLTNSGRYIALLSTGDGTVGGGVDVAVGFGKNTSAPYVFYSSAGVAPADRLLTITNSGNVGIGTSTPTTKLEVAGDLKVTGTGTQTLDKLTVSRAGSDVLVNTTAGSWLTLSSAGGRVLVGATSGLFVPTGVNTGTQNMVLSAGVDQASATNDIVFQSKATELVRMKANGNVGIGTSTPGTRLDVVGGPISVGKDVIGVAATEPLHDSPAYITVFTKIPFVNEPAVQLRIRGFGYFTPADSEVTLSWYQYNNIFYAPGTVTKFHSAVGKMAPSSIRLGVWDDAGTPRVAIEYANDSRYWTSYHIDAYRHDAAFGSSYYSGWTIASGAFGGGITNIVAVPQTGEVVQTSAGNVGIGTTAPAYKLDVAGTAHFKGSNALYSGLIVDGNGDVGINTTPTRLGSHITTLHLAGSSADNNYGGGLLLTSNNKTSVSAAIYNSTNGLDLQNNSATPIRMFTNGIERLRVDASGNVGIGTTTPTARLSLAQGTTAADGISFGGDSNLYRTAVNYLATDSSLLINGPYLNMNGGTILLGSGGLSGPSDITFRSAGAASSTISPVFKSKDSTGSLQDNLRFSTVWLNSTPGSLSNTVTMKSLGTDIFTVNATPSSGSINFNTNVGIGTNAPSQLLHVAGNARISGGLFDSGNTAGTAGQLLTSTGTGTQWQSAATALASTAYVQGGNSFGALATLGTNDANALAVRTNGVERLRIDNTGKVGIGTSAPADLLVLNGSGGSSGLSFIRPSDGATMRALSTPDSGTLRVGGGNQNNVDIYGHTSFVARFTNSGNVGIGTTAPDSLLEVVGASSNVAGPMRQYQMVSGYNASVSSVTGTLKITLPKLSSNTMMQVRINGYDYSSAGAWELLLGGYNYQTNAWVNTSAALKGRAPFSSIRFANDGTNSVILLGTVATNWSYPKVMVSAFTPGHLNTTGWATGWSMGLITDESAIANVTPITPDISASASGNVGIGTLAPSQKLHVAGNAYITGALHDSSNGPGTAGHLLTSTGTGTQWRSVANALGSSVYLQGGNSFGATADLGTNDGNALAMRTSGLERMRLDAAGNLGIGTASPAYKLDVAGNVQFTGSNNTQLRFDSNGANARIFSGGPIEIQSNQTTGSSVLISKNGGLAGDTATLLRVADNTGLAAASARLLDVGGKLFVQADGTVAAGNTRQYSVTRTLGATAGDFTEIASFSTSNGANSFEVVLTDQGAGSSASKHYHVASNWDDHSVGGAWREVLPLYNSGARGGGDYTLDRQGNPNTLRIRRTVTNPHGGTNVLVTVRMLDNETLTLSSATGTGATVVGLYRQAALTQVQGRVGIGTAAPSLALSVVGGAYDGLALDASSSAHVRFLNTGTTAGFLGNNGANNLLSGAASATMVLRSEAALELATGGNNRRVLIDASGNVGIGTTSPAEKLHVAGNVQIGNSATSLAGERITRTSSGVDASIHTFIPVNNSPHYQTLYGGYWTGERAGVAHANNAFYVDAVPVLGTMTWGVVGAAGSFSTAGMTDLLTLKSNGFLGIGTASPSQKLHVAGNAFITGALYDSANSPGTAGQLLTSTATGTSWLSPGAALGLPPTGVIPRAYRQTWTVTAGNLRPLAKFSLAEGVISLMVQVQSMTSGHSGTNLYLFQGGFSQLTTGWYRMQPMNTGRGHGDSTQGFDLYVRQGSNGYEYEFAVGANTNAKNLVVTFSELTGSNITYTDTSASGESASSSLGDVYSVRAFNMEGRLGIGTSAPTARLNIHQASSGWSDGIRMSNAGGANTYTLLNDSGSNFFSIAANNTYTSSINLVAASGNVGIGTNSPVEKLDVAGNLRLSGYIDNGQRVSTRTYSVNTATPAVLLDGAGSPLALDKTYLLEAYVEGTATPTGAKAIVSSDGGGTNRLLTVLHEAGRFSNHVELFMNAGVPSVRLYGHAGMYSVRVKLTETTSSTVRSTAPFDMGNIYQTTAAVGIGTTAPSQLLHVAGNVRITGALYDSSNSAGTTGQLLTSTGTGTQWQSAASALGSSAYLQGGNSFGATANLGTNDNNALAFRTNGVERMRLDAAGNLGIGTTNPTGALQVAGNATFGVAGTASGTGAITLRADSGSAYAKLGQIGFVRSNYNPNENAAEIQFYRGGAGPEGALAFATQSGAASLAERMRITESGNVGIGNAAPTSLLMVGTPSGGQTFGARLEVAEGDFGLVRNSADNRISTCAFCWSLPASAYTAFTLSNQGNSDAGVRREMTRMESLVTGTANNAESAAIAFSTRNSGTLVETMRLVGGNVGIGTTTPSSRLHISDGNPISAALYTSDYHLVSAQGAAPGYNIAVASSSSASHRGVFKGTRARGTLAVPLVPLNNDFTFSLLGAIYDGSTNYATAGIEMAVDGTVSAGVAPQRIGFYTSAGNSRVERMRIDSAGNVGIGTSAPSALLQLNQPNTAGVVPLLVTRASSASDYLTAIEYNQFRLSGASWGANALSSWAVYDAANDTWAAQATTTVGSALQIFETNGSVTFYNRASTAVTAGQALAFNTTMTLTGAGNVGIGTAPSERLHITDGRVRVGAGPDSGVLEGGTGFGSKLRLNYADGAANVLLKGNGDSYLNANYGRVGVGTSSPTTTLSVGATNLPTGTISTVAGLLGKGVLIQADGEALNTKTGYWTRFSASPGIAAGITMGRMGTGWGTFIAFHNHGDQTTTIDSSPELMRIDSAGNVGIGTAPSERLHITDGRVRVGAGPDSGVLEGGTGFGSKLRLNYADGAANVLLQGNGDSYLNANYGRVGVGTSSPTTTLSVGATNLPTGTISTVAGLLGKGVLIQADGEALNTKTGYWTRFSASPGIAAGITMGRMGTGWGTFIAFHNHGDQTTTIDSSPELMRIDSAGNVGIGTNAPTAKLSVYEISVGANRMGRFVQGYSGAGTNAAVDIVSAVAGGSALDVGHWSNSSGDWAFRAYRNASRSENANVSDAGSIFLMGVRADGNVGIGTSSPQAKLHIFNGDNTVGAVLATTSNGFSLVTKSITDSVANSSAFKLGFSYGGWDAANGYIDFKRGGTGTDGYLAFGTSATERMMISNTGVVRVNGLAGAPAATAMAANDGIVVADTNGDLSKRSLSTVMGANDYSNNNLAYNGDFETGTADGWTAMTTPTIVTGGYADNYAAQYTGSGNILGNTYIPVNPTTDVLQLEVYAKKTVAGGTPGVIYLGYIAYDANKVAITTAPCGTYCYFAASASTVPVDGNWHKYSATTTGEGTAYPNFPVGTKYVRVLGLINYNASADAVTLVDHITVKRINHGPLFVGNNFSGTNMVNQQQVTQLYTTASNHFIISPPATGNVGIGTTSPSYRLTITSPNSADTLQVNSSAASGQARIQLNGGAGGVGQIDNGVGDFYLTNTSATGSLILRAATTEYMRILHTGNVGIGNNSPSARLEVYNTAAAGHLVLSGNDDGASDGSRIAMDFKIRAANHTLARIASKYEDSNNGGSGSLRFLTLNAGTLADRMFIAASGNVGIGTTNPTSRLEVGGSTSTTVSIGTTGDTGKFQLINGGNNANHNWQFTVGGDQWILQRDGLDLMVFNNVGSMIVKNSLQNNVANATFRIGATGANSQAVLTSSGLDRLTIDAVGNVGIGTSTPAYRLDVNGDMRAVGNVYAANIRHFLETRTMPTTVNSTVDIGGFYIDHSAQNFDVAVNVGNSSFSVSKRYAFAVNWCTVCTSGAWYTVLPVSSTGNNNGNDFDLEVRQENSPNTLSMRLRRSSGSNVGTAVVSIHDRGKGTAGFTASSTVNTGVAATVGIWHTASLTQINSNVGIGLANPGYKLEVAGAVGATAFTNTSDIRFKRDITPLKGAVARIALLRGVSYRWRKDDFPQRGFDDKVQIGFIAQELETVLPELVSTDGEGFKSVAYTGVIPLVVEAVKELHRTMEPLLPLAKLADKLKLGSDTVTVEVNAPMKVQGPLLVTGDFTAATIKAKKVVADEVQAGRVNTGEQQFTLEGGWQRELLELPVGATYTVVISGPDGSFVHATVLNTGGVVQVSAKHQNGLDLQAQGNRLRVVNTTARTKQLAASWIRTG